MPVMRWASFSNSSSRLIVVRTVLVPFGYAHNIHHMMSTFMHQTKVCRLTAHSSRPA
jgi:hypothetical protein